MVDDLLYTDDLTRIAEMVYGVTDEVTSLGEVVYHKTLFKNTATGESCYLLDQLMGLEHHARITEDAEARILKEASESRHRKGGMNASINGGVISKEAVMNKLHRLEFPALEAGEKKELKRLYIDADDLVLLTEFISMRMEPGGYAQEKRSFQSPGLPLISTTSTNTS